MTENLNETEFTVANWLAGQTPIEKSVEIIQDGALAAKWDDWVRRYERAAADAVDESELLVGEKSKIAVLREEGAALLEKIEASRTTWYVRGLGSEDLIQIAEAHPWPVDPTPVFEMVQPELRKGATDAHSIAFRAANDNYWKAYEEHRQAHAVEREKYAHAVSLVAMARGYEKVARAFVRAEQGGEVVISTLTAAEARLLHQAVGDIPFQLIVNAIDSASQESEPIPGDADFLSITSAKTTV